jgi:hypothetical protein
MISINVTGSLRKGVVPLYRVFSMLALYGILSGIIFFGVLFVFFLGSNSWVSPFVISPSDVPVLSIISQITTSQATVDTLQLDYKASSENAEFSKAQVKQLFAFNKELRAKLGKQSAEWADATQDLSKYDTEAKTNIDTVMSDVNNGEELRRLVKRDLAAGLITNEDALATYSSIDMLKINTTAAKVAESDLKDSIRQHKMDDLTSLSVEGQAAALEFQLAQLYSAIKTDDQHMVSDLETIATINRAVKIAKQSPYYLAAQDAAVQLGVIPYDPKITLKTGEPVYNCALWIVDCRKVGTVFGVYPNELVFENPLTKTNTRGYIVQIQVTNEAMRSKALMVGRKPLWF